MNLLEKASPKTPEERVEELKELLETPLQIPFDKAHEKIEELMQRPTWTHELAFPQLLYDEILSGKKGYAFNESINEIQHRMGKPTIFAIIDKEEKGENHE